MAGGEEHGNVCWVDMESADEIFQVFRGLGLKKMTSLAFIGLAGQLSVEVPS